MEIKLSALYFKPDLPPKILITNLVDEIRYRGDYLMKLTLSNMNLGDDVIVEAICETILSKRIL